MAVTDRKISIVHDSSSIRRIRASNRNDCDRETSLELLPCGSCQCNMNVWVSKQMSRSKRILRLLWAVVAQQTAEQPGAQQRRGFSIGLHAAGRRVEK